MVLRRCGFAEDMVEVSWQEMVLSPWMLALMRPFMGKGCLIF
jgi:hypothetical protein